jgi:hypothetical protein
MHRTIRGLLALAAVTFVTACSDSSGPNSVTGNYALIAINGINGSGLPVTIYKDESVEFRVTAGNVTLSSNNTFSASGTGQATQAGQTTTVAETCAGTYTVSGNSITFTGAPSTDCHGVITGTWDGANTITITAEATVQIVFRK